MKEPLLRYIFMMKKQKTNLLENDFCLLVHWRNPFIVSAGSEKYIQKQVDILKINRIDSVVIFPVTKKIGITIFGWGLLINKQFIGVYDERVIISSLHTLLKMRKCKGVLVHHLMLSDLESLRRILSFTDKILFYVHDFYSCCEQQNLLRNDEIYCGDSKINEQKCSDCKYYKASFEKKYKTELFFSSFREVQVIAPSIVAANIWKEAYPDYKDNIHVIDHLNVEARRIVNDKSDDNDERLNVAFVGNGIKSKGWFIWNEALKELPDDIKNQYNFFHLGRVDKEYDYIKHIPVSVANEGANAMVRALQNNNIDVTVLVSLCPETYSYTFFEALEARCFVITTEISGNIKEKVMEFENGMVIKPDSGALKACFCNVYNLKKLKIESNVYDVHISDNTSFLMFLKDIEINDFDCGKIKRGKTAWIAHVLYRLRYKNKLKNVWR